MPQKHCTIFRILTCSTELSTQNQLENLLKENLNPTQKESNGKDMAQQSVEQAGIDWNKYM